MSSALNAGAGGGGSPPLTKESELTAEESAEFSDTLKSLETTMKLHMSVLSVKRGLGAGGGVGGTAAADDPSSVAAVTAPAGGLMAPAPPPRSLSRLRRESTRVNGVSMPNRTDKVTVYVRIMFLKVGEIDTLRDKFSADAFVQAKWREPSMDGKLRMQSEDINWEIYWNPKLSIENVFGDPKESVWYSVAFDGTGQATVCEKRRINGTFLEFMELNQFPFDSQDLTVTLTTDRDESEIEFVEDPKERCSLNVQSFVDEQEWKLHRYIHTWTKTHEEAFKNNQAKHPAFSAACKASRRPQFFIWNIFVVMFLICSLSFATFSVSYGFPQNRLQLTFILLLTTVSFKFVVNQSLPMIAYLTYLDKYILGSMAILATICVWHAFIPFVSTTILPCQPDRVAQADMIAFGILATVYVAFHLGLLCAIACLAKENSIYDKGDASIDQGRGNFAFEEDYEENGNIPEMFHDKLDVKAIRKQNASEQTTNQQTVMSAWQ